MRLPPPSDPVASTRLQFNRQDGTALEITVELHRPEPADDQAWACAFVVRGFGEDVVGHIIGIDSMQALVLSLHVVPTELAAIARDERGSFSTKADLGPDHACTVHLG